MLGRLANNLFWMSRYLERAENNARLLETYLRRGLSEKYIEVDDWLAILAITGQSASYKEKIGEHNQTAIINFILREKDDPASVLNLVKYARQNARIVRTALTRETWQAINDFWLYLQKNLNRPAARNDLPIILAKVREGSSLVRGAIDGTMLRNDIYQFIRLGVFIERSDNTARHLSSRYNLFIPSENESVEGYPMLRFEMILDAVGVMRAYKWVNKGQIEPDRVIKFLLNDPTMPRSLIFCYHDIVRQLTALENEYGKTYEALNIAKKIQSDLAITLKETLVHDDIINFTSTFIFENAQLSKLVEKEFKFNP